jgi:poly-gamma-glutamate synthesis protein (capsule biosynthesis protein)
LRNYNYPHYPVFCRRLINYRSYQPVITISRKGWLLVKTIRFLYHLLYLLRIVRFPKPWREHHEDPARMNTKMQLYLGYKYYFKAMAEDEVGSGIKAALLNSQLKLDIPADFHINTTYTLHAGGDLIPYTAITPDTCKNLWNHVGDFFFGANLVVANLESPADFSKPYSAAPEVMLNDMYFNIDAPTWHIFKGNGQHKGYDLVSIANNHSLDQGEEGLQNTISFLNKQGVAWTGAAESAIGIHTVPVLERKGIKTGFIAATFSLNKEQLPPHQPWLCNHILLNEENPDISRLIDQADIARANGADCVVAMLHMGCAYQAFPGTIVRDNIHRICDATNVDIIIAGHPHHAQPIELYHSTVTGKQHVIIYSLGDFIAYDIYKWGHLTLLLHLEISKGVRNGQQETRVTRIGLKPAYMHAIIKQQQVTELELLDYQQVKQSPNTYLKDKQSQQEFAELADFFERFVLPPHQQHLLI